MGACALALPLIIILIGQVILLAVFAALIIYNTNGRDYDAAVMAGFYGYAMGLPERNGKHERRCFTL